MRKPFFWSWFSSNVKTNDKKWRQWKPLLPKKMSSPHGAHPQIYQYMKRLWILWTSQNSLKMHRWDLLITDLKNVDVGMQHSLCLVIWFRNYSSGCFLISPCMWRMHLSRVFRPNGPNSPVSWKRNLPALYSIHVRFFPHCPSTLAPVVINYIQVMMHSVDKRTGAFLSQY